MSGATYLWRKLTPKQREGLMVWRKRQGIHNNPVHHGYAGCWQGWPFSSAQEYLAEMGRTFAEKTWREYPILDYGKGWDDAKL